MARTLYTEENGLRGHAGLGDWGQAARKMESKQLERQDRDPEGWKGKEMGQTDRDTGSSGGDRYMGGQRKEEGERQREKDGKAATQGKTGRERNTETQRKSEDRDQRRQTQRGTEGRI